MRRSKSLVAHKLPRAAASADRLANPGLHRVAIRSDIGRRLDRVDAEQLSRAASNARTSSNCC